MLIIGLMIMKKMIMKILNHLEMKNKQAEAMMLLVY